MNNKAGVKRSQASVHSGWTAQPELLFLVRGVEVRAPFDPHRRFFPCSSFHSSSQVFSPSLHPSLTSLFTRTLLPGSVCVLSPRPRVKHGGKEKERKLWRLFFFSSFVWGIVSHPDIKENESSHRGHRRCLRRITGLSGFLNQGGFAALFFFFQGFFAISAKTFQKLSRRDLEKSIKVLLKPADFLL